MEGKGANRGIAVGGVGVGVGGPVGHRVGARLRRRAAEAARGGIEAQAGHRRREGVAQGAVAAEGRGQPQGEDRRPCRVGLRRDGTEHARGEVARRLYADGEGARGGVGAGVGDPVGHLVGAGLGRATTEAAGGGVEAQARHLGSEGVAQLTVAAGGLGQCEGGDEPAHGIGRRGDGVVQQRGGVRGGIARAHCDGNGRGAVVRGIRFPGHRIDARAVVIRAGVRRRRQADRLRARARSGEGAHRVGADRRIGRGNRRVRGPVVAQRRRGRPTIACIANRRAQRERRTRIRTRVAHRRRPDRQVRGADARRRLDGDGEGAGRRVAVGGVGVGVGGLVGHPPGARLCRCAAETARGGVEAQPRHFGSEGVAHRTVAAERARQSQRGDGRTHRVRRRSDGAEHARGEVARRLYVEGKGANRGIAVGGVGVGVGGPVGHRVGARLRRRAAEAARGGIEAQAGHRRREGVAQGAVAAEGRGQPQGEDRRPCRVGLRRDGTEHARGEVARRLYADGEGARGGVGAGVGDPVGHLVGAGLGRATTEAAGGGVEAQARHLGSEGVAQLTVAAGGLGQCEGGDEPAHGIGRRGDGVVQQRGGVRGGIARAHRDGDGRGAVVRGVRFPGHGVHARTVVVSPGTRRRRQADRLCARARSGEGAHRVGADRRIGRGDGRVRRAVVAQRRRRGSVGARVANRRAQRERCPRIRTGVAHRRRADRQIRNTAGHRVTDSFDQPASVALAIRHESDPLAVDRRVDDVQASAGREEPQSPASGGENGELQVGTGICAALTCPYPLARLAFARIRRRGDGRWRRGRRWNGPFGELDRTHIVKGTPDIRRVRTGTRSCSRKPQPLPARSLPVVSAAQGNGEPYSE